MYCLSDLTSKTYTNLVVQTHSASYGFSPHRRHAVRVAVQAERPVLVESGKSQEEDLAALYGLPAVNKDGSRQSNYND